MNRRWIFLPAVAAVAALGVFVATTHQSSVFQADQSSALTPSQPDQPIRDVRDVASDDAAGESVKAGSAMERSSGSAHSEELHAPSVASPSRAKHFSGQGESSLLGPEGSINSQSAEALLSAGNFEEFAGALARGSESPSSAIANEQDYRAGLEAALSGLDGAGVGTVGCGTTLCVVEISASGALDDIHERVVEAFGERGLPGNVLIPLVMPGQAATTRLRLVVGFGPDMQGIYIPPGAVPVGS